MLIRRIVTFYPDARQHLAASAPVIGSLAVKFGGAGLSFLATLLIARLYGATVAGSYALAVQTTLTASAIALFGNDQLMVRRVAGDFQLGRKDLARGALSHAVRVVGVASVVLAAVLVLLSPFAGAIGAQPITIALSGAGVLVFPLLCVAVGLLRVAGRVVISQFFYGCLQSLLLVLLLAGMELTAWQHNATSVVLAYIVSMVLTSLAGLWLMRRIVSGWPEASAKSKHGVWESRDIGLTAGIHLLTNWAVLALAGALLGLADVGAFRICLQILTIITMIVATVETIVAPGFAAAFRAGDMAGVRRRHLRATALLAAFAGPPILLCIVFARPILALFGPEFVGAALALQVLAAGQAANVLTGPVGAMLIMGSAERMALIVGVVGLVLSVVLMWALAPNYGLAGAAVAYTAAVIVRNLASFVAVRRRVTGLQSAQRSPLPNASRSE